MDLVMGRFADTHLPTMSDDELAEFERLLDVPDPQALAWIIGGEEPPREFLTPLFARLRGPRGEALKASRRGAVNLSLPRFAASRRAAPSRSRARPRGTTLSSSPSSRARSRRPARAAP